MGGASALLMIALAGITYGWQPDQQGGVEYIIQISPTELQEIERLGDFSSAIDPQVRGQVSKVIVRVGSGRLPRETPRLSTAGHHFDRNVMTASDYSPIAIPEMKAGREVPNRQLAAQPDRSGTAVMKPDPQDAGASPGFSFPTTLRNNVDQAGREIADRGSQAIGNFRDRAADTLRSNTSRGSETPLVSRANLQQPGAARNPNTRFAAPGPSTEPVDRRDRTWQNDLSRQRTTGGPSTEPIGSQFSNNPLDRRTNQAAFGRNQQPTLGRSTNGLRANEMFGRTPNTGPGERQAGMGFGETVPGGIYSQLEQMPPGTLRNDQRVSAGGQNPVTAWPRNGPTTTAANAPLLNDRQRDPTNLGAGYARNPGGLTPQQTALGRNQNQIQREPYSYGTSQRDFARSPNVYPQRDPRDVAGRGGYQDQDRSPAGGTPNLQLAADRRLSADEIAAGAWTLDRLDRPVDRNGQLVRPRGYAGPYPSAGYQDRRTADPRNLAPRALAGPPYQSGNPMRTGAATPIATANEPYQRRNDNANFQTTGPVPGNNPTYQARPVAATDPPSISNRFNPNANTPGSAVEGGVAGQRSSGNGARQVAAPPLFLWLLLISGVANIYLLFWLKNLRLQFRDLVAANRLANSAVA